MAGVLDALRSRIVTGELPPGTRLNQAQLAEFLGVSRIPVRDALQALAGEGLVTMAGRAGASVTRISIADLQELYELRGAIEPLASRLATSNLGRAHLLRMDRFQAIMEDARDPLAWLEANTAFHATLYERSNRPRMIQLVANLRRQTDRYLHLDLPVVEEHAHTEHRRILGAARRGDAAAVEALTRAHLETAHELILRFLLEHEVAGTDPAPRIQPPTSTSQEAVRDADHAS